MQSLTFRILLKNIHQGLYGKVKLHLVKDDCIEKNLLASILKKNKIKLIDKDSLYLVKDFVHAPKQCFT
jgi:hypothetical protein